MFNFRRVSKFSTGLFLIVIFLLNFQTTFGATAGCCIKSTKTGSYGTSNCIKNVASAADCTKQWPGGIFESGDSSCNGAGTAKFCTTVTCNGNNYAGTATTNMLNCYKDCGETASCVASCDKCFNNAASSKSTDTTATTADTSTTTKNGCCVKSTKKDDYGTSNCLKNVADAKECYSKTKSTSFVGGDANCDGEGTKEFCSAAKSSDSEKSSSLTTSTSFTNPLSYNTVEELLTNILSAIQKIVVVLALVVIVIGAVMYIVSTGESEMVERAKKAITMAIMGLAIAIAAPSILKELSVILKWEKDLPSDVTNSLTFSEIGVNVLNFLLGVAGVLAIIMMVIGGIMYLTSTGDEERIKKGKSIFTYSLIGIIIVLASLVIVRQIAQFFVSS